MKEQKNDYLLWVSVWWRFRSFPASGHSVRWPGNTLSTGWSAGRISWRSLSKGSGDTGMIRRMSRYYNLAGCYWLGSRLQLWTKSCHSHLLAWPFYAWRARSSISWSEYRWSFIFVGAVVESSIYRRGSPRWFCWKSFITLRALISACSWASWLGS